MTDQELIARLLADERDLSDCDVNRIAEVVKERDKFREVFNTSSILLGETELQLEEAEAKLAKAVEALRFYAYGHSTPPTSQRAHKVLAELEK